MTDSNFAIDAINLSKVFNGKIAVDNLSVKVKKGEIYAFLGPNGAGKSTTIKMLVTLLDSTSGDIFINGIDVKQNSIKARLNIGVALQEASLDESQTGIEFLHLQGRLYGLSKNNILDRIEELKSLVDIGDSLNKQIKTYSGGMKRRLDLAAAIFHKPAILFLDEPTTGLDPVSRSKVWNEVKKLNQVAETTIFLTTQYLEEADNLADKVGIINNGKLVIEGTVSELKKSVGEDLIIVRVKNLTYDILTKIRQISGVTKAESHEQELTISTASGADMVGKIALELSKANLSIDYLEMRTTSLDDVFLEVTGNRLKTE